MADHPDQSRPFEVDGENSVPVGPGHGSFDRARLDFGHYAGQSIEELAERDPDYLRWLARTPAGARFRPEIERVLGPLPIVQRP